MKINTIDKNQLLVWCLKCSHKEFKMILSGYQYEPNKISICSKQEFKIIPPKIQKESINLLNQFKFLVGSFQTLPPQLLT